MPLLGSLAAGLGSQEMPEMVWMRAGLRVDLRDKAYPGMQAVPGNPLSGRRAGVNRTKHEGKFNLFC